MSTNPNPPAASTPPVVVPAPLIIPPTPIGALAGWLLMPESSAGLKWSHGGAAPTVYGRDISHLEGVKLDGSKAPPNYQWLSPSGKTAVFMKGASGNPWDFKQLNGQGVYDWVTELSSAAWSDPSAYKEAAPPVQMWMVSAGGLPAIGFGAGKATWTENQKGKQIGSISVGKVWYALAGPYPVNYGGDLGTLWTLILSYFWNGGTVREELYLTREFGWVRWSTANLKPTTPGAPNEYLVTDVTAHNQIVAGGAPKPNFSGFAIP